MISIVAVSLAARTAASDRHRRYHCRPERGWMYLRSVVSPFTLDERTRKLLREQGAEALRAALGSTKRASRALRLQLRWTRELLSGRTDTAVSRFLELLITVGRAGGEPWRLVVLARVTAYRAVMAMSDAAAHVRAWRVESAEAVRTAGAVVARMAGGHDDVVALERELLACAQACERAAARLHEMRERKIGPAER